ncbi:MAG: carboxypeptidase regulatory-like domain-containing protein [Planctomycetota bacterium]|nr:carboxypeptidase regulatory-like domain-containing protein [Planctomycetota bacterium]
MMKRMLGIMCLAAVAATSAQAQEGTITGTVVDGSGKPLEGASVATIWLEGRPAGGATTDADGKFTLQTRTSSRAVAVLVMDEDCKRGVVSRYDPGSFDEERTLELKRLVKVHGKFTSTRLGEAPSWTNVYANLMPERIRVGRYSSREAEFSFLLPPGDYQFHMYGTDVKKQYILRSIEGNEGVIDLGTIDLDATEIAKMYGKRPPVWTVTDARAVDKKIQLSAYKGKYVLLEFWGYW